MNRNKANCCRGIVVALKANFLIVEIDLYDSKELHFNLNSKNFRLLCTRRSKLDFKGIFINVGDIVFV